VTVEIEVLYRDAHWIGVRKSPGLPTTPHEGHVSLLERVRSFIGETEALHPLSRLDLEVSGVVLFALNFEATRRGAVAKARGAYEREYHALVSPAPPAEHAEYRWDIGTNPRNPNLRVAGGGREREPAHSAMRVRERRGEAAWVELVPYTGRTHQLRVHCAKAGNPILGDRAYRGRSRLTLSDGAVVAAGRVMLHLARVSLAGDVVIDCPAPLDYLNLWAALDPAT
jgi:23S rRNA-/tRNA-specific pseudouridylate synthase